MGCRVWACPSLPPKLIGRKVLRVENGLCTRHDWRSGWWNFFRDVVEFLGCSADSYSGYEDDLELIILLLMGTPEDVGNKMNDTDLVARLLDDELSYSHKNGFPL